MMIELNAISVFLKDRGWITADEWEECSDGYEMTAVPGKKRREGPFVSMETNRLWMMVSDEGIFEAWYTTPKGHGPDWIEIKTGVESNKIFECDLVDPGCFERFEKVLLEVFP